MNSYAAELIDMNEATIYNTTEFTTDLDTTQTSTKNQVYDEAN